MISVANEWGDEELLSLPPTALTSDAALAGFAPGRSCFDVAVRLWRGAEPEVTVSLEVDGRATGTPVKIHQCKGDTPCTPSDWRLPVGVADADERVRRMARRACFETPTVPRHEVTLTARQGAASMRFRWQFDSD